MYYNFYIYYKIFLIILQGTKISHKILWTHISQDWSPFNLEFYVAWIHVAESKTKMHSSLIESNNIRPRPNSITIDLAIIQ